MSYIKIFLKFALAIIAIFWLVLSGKVDFSLIKVAFTNGHGWSICIFLLILQIIINSFRWKLLLEIKLKQKIFFKDVLKINWVGQFVSSVLPGIFFGDIFKFNFFLSKNYDISKKYLAFTILLDRIIGLTSLLILNSLLMLFAAEKIVQLSPQFKSIFFISVILGGGAVLFFAGLIFKTPAHDFILKILKKIEWKYVQKFSTNLDQVYELRNHRLSLIKALFLGYTTHIMSIIGFISLTCQFWNFDANVLDVATILPLGYVITAIPALPLGVGVGHVAFQNLFQFLQINNGASLFNIFVVISLIVNILGIVPFLLHEKK